MKYILCFLMFVLILLALTLLFLPIGSASYARYVQAEERTVEEIVLEQATKYKVSSSLMLNLMKCESGMNANAINSTAKEYSVGLVQINLKAHTHIKEEQAKDPYFASSFMAKNLSEGKGKMWFTCYRRALANLEMPSKS